MDEMEIIKPIYISSKINKVIKFFCLSSIDSYYINTNEGYDEIYMNLNIEEKIKDIKELKVIIK